MAIDEVQSRGIQGEQLVHLDAVLDHADAAFAIKSLGGVYEFANRAFLNLFELDDSPVGTSHFSSLPADVAADMWEADIAAMRTRQCQFRDYRLGKGAQQRVVKARHHLLAGVDDSPIKLIFEAVDATDAARHIEQLDRTARIVEQAQLPLAIVDLDGVITYANGAMSTLTKNSHYDSLHGRRLSEIVAVTGEHPISIDDALASQPWRGEARVMCGDCDVVTAWMTTGALLTAAGDIDGYVVALSQATAAAPLTGGIEYLVSHDELTRLPNRVYFSSQLGQALESVKTSHEPLAVLFVDLDDFKSINDTVGHAIGDETLRNAANTLRRCVTPHDLVARVGGDEFVVLLPRHDRAQAQVVAARILAQMSVPFTVAGVNTYCSASIGIAVGPYDAKDPEGLIQAADAAMYRAKHQGRNRFSHFDPSMRVELTHDALIARALRQSILEGGFRLVFQSKHAVQDPEFVVGAEALLRWNPAELGETGPAEFIPVAERTGLIRAIDRISWALLMDQLVAWRDEAVPLVPIAFNVSAWSLRELDFTAHVLASLSERDLPASLIHLELTEGALVNHHGIVGTNLATLSAAGVVISVDDFGVGYSSLTYLKKLPLSELKIDKSFTDGLGHNQADEAISLAVLSVAKSLGLEVVAEGVETAAQLEWLTRHDCAVAQGYLFSKPVEADQFAEILAKGSLLR